MNFKPQNTSKYSPSYGSLMMSYSNAEFAFTYGFQGYEMDNELKGNGNSYTTEFRQYDPRIGRWLSVDPRDVPSFSPYSCFANNPIIFIDIHGDSASSNTHTIKSGETLSGIAKQYGTTIDELMQLNQNNSAVKSENLIIAGGQLIIPNPNSTVEDSRSWHPPMIKPTTPAAVSPPPAAVSNIYKIKVYGSDIAGMGYGTVKLYSTANNPSGMPSWESVSYGMSNGAPTGIDLNIFTGAIATMTFNAEWVRNLNPSNISDIANAVVFNITLVGSFATGFYGKVTARDPSTQAVVGTSNLMFGAGAAVGLQRGNSRGGFVESPVDTVNTYLLNLKYGRGDTTAQKKFLESKGIKRN